MCGAGWRSRGEGGGRGDPARRGVGRGGEQRRGVGPGQARVAGTGAGAPPERGRGARGRPGCGREPASAGGLRAKLKRRAGRRTVPSHAEPAAVTPDGWGRESARGEREPATAAAECAETASRGGRPGIGERAAWEARRGDDMREAVAASRRARDAEPASGAGAHEAAAATRPARDAEPERARHGDSAARRRRSRTRRGW